MKIIDSRIPTRVRDPFVLVENGRYYLIAEATEIAGFAIQARGI